MRKIMLISIAVILLSLTLVIADEPLLDKIIEIISPEEIGQPIDYVEPVDNIKQELIALPEEIDTIEIKDGMDSVVMTEIDCDKKEFKVSGGKYNLDEKLYAECGVIDNRQEVLANRIKELDSVYEARNTPQIKNTDFEVVRLKR